MRELENEFRLSCQIVDSLRNERFISFRLWKQQQWRDIPSKSSRPETIRPLRWWPSYNFEQKWDPLLQVPREVDSQTNCRLRSLLAGLQIAACNLRAIWRAFARVVSATVFHRGKISSPLRPTLVLHLADRSRWTYPWAREERFNFLSRTNRPFNGHPRFLNDSRK